MYCWGCAVHQKRVMFVGFNLVACAWQRIGVDVCPVCFPTLKPCARKLCGFWQESTDVCAMRDRCDRRALWLAPLCSSLESTRLPSFPITSGCPMPRLSCTKRGVMSARLFRCVQAIRHLCGQSSGFKRWVGSWWQRS